MAHETAMPKPIFLDETLSGLFLCHLFLLSNMNTQFDFSKVHIYSHNSNIVVSLVICKL